MTLRGADMTLRGADTTLGATLARAAACLLLVAATAACGSSGDRAAAPTTAAPPATTTAPTATTTAAAVPTSTGATTAIVTAAPTTSTTAVPTTVTLPTPIMPPPEHQAEPELILGRISIPRLDLDLEMFSGITLPTLDKGPGHWPGTAMPGTPGNVVVAGHRVSSTRPFRHIDELVEGDQVTFTVDGVESRYVVTGHEIVTPDAIRIIEQTPAKTATLFACHPPGSTEFRWVVHLVAAD